MLVDGNPVPYRCMLRGKFKKDLQTKKDKLYTYDLATVGDRVEFDPGTGGTGFIHKIHDRRNYLSRKALKIKGANYRGERLEQVIAANTDKLFIVSSTQQPKFNNRLIDRIIVAGESARVDTAVVINKMDLCGEDDEIHAWIELYREIGYKVFPVSAKINEGIDDLRDELSGFRNVFWGQSGVGKSSVLNSLFPALNLKTGDVSTFSQKGRHTTVTCVLNRIDENTDVIDTPGIREIDPYGISKENLSHYFREFAEFIPSCRFNTCTHFHEPECAVRDAAERGDIPPERYESYLNLLNTVEDDIFF